MMSFMGNPLRANGSALNGAFSAFSFDKMISHLIHFSVGFCRHFSLDLHYLLPCAFVGASLHQIRPKGLHAVLRRGDKIQSNSELCLSGGQVGCHSPEVSSSGLSGCWVTGKSLSRTHLPSGRCVATLWDSPGDGKEQTSNYQPAAGALGPGISISECYSN